eukprot:Hpha_TRINITY_DN15606_c1_g13::TRINITY_DN15606_c1_g13_i1::g.100731::m.100731
MVADSSVESGLAAYYRKHNPRMAGRAAALARTDDLEGLRARLLKQYPGTEADLGFLDGAPAVEPHQPPRAPADRVQRGEQPGHWRARSGGRQASDERVQRSASPYAVERKDAPWEPQGPPAQRRVRSPGDAGPAYVPVAGSQPGATATDSAPAGRKLFSKPPPAGSIPDSYQGGVDRPVYADRASRRVGDSSPERERGSRNARDTTDFGRNDVAPIRMKKPGDRGNAGVGSSPYALGGSYGGAGGGGAARGGYSAPPPVQSEGITFDTPAGPLKTQGGSLVGFWLVQQTQGAEIHDHASENRLIEVQENGELFSYVHRGWFGRQKGHQKSWGILEAPGGGQWGTECEADAERVGRGKGQDDYLEEGVRAVISEHFGTNSQGLKPKYLQWDDGSLWTRQPEPKALVLKRNPGESTGLFVDELTADENDGTPAVYIHEVGEGGAAETSGFDAYVGSQILDIDGVPVFNTSDMRACMPRDGDWTEKVIRFRPPVEE